MRQEPSLAFLLERSMSNKNLVDQISEIEEHISHLQWRCEGTINHSEIKKLNKTIKSLNKTKLKLSKKLLNNGSQHDQIT